MAARHKGDKVCCLKSNLFHIEIFIHTEKYLHIMFFFFGKTNASWDCPGCTIMIQRVKAAAAAAAAAGSFKAYIPVQVPHSHALFYAIL